jgi:peroxiredoxin
MARPGCVWHGSFWQGIALCVVGMGLWQHVPTAGAADTSPPLPRYRFEVRQELTYKGAREFRYKEKGTFHSFGDRAAWTVWVVRKNENGTSRVVIRSSEASWAGSKKFRPPQLSLGYCDVTADGRTSWNRSLGFHFDPGWLFPALPPDGKSLAAGWQYLRPNDNGFSRYRLISQPVAPLGVWTIGETYESPLREIYLSNSNSTVTFDAARGLMTKVENQGSVPKDSETQTETREFVSAERRDAAWIAQLRDETDHYFQAHAAYEQKTEEAAKDAVRSKQLMEEGRTLLTTARASVRLPIVAEQLDRLLNSHKGLAEARAEKAENRAKVVGHPAARWELRDLAGKTHSLADYRGKVVLLDFWYRNCPWCLRSVPQLKQLSAAFQGQHVILIGMNVDKFEADARFVVEKMRLDYLNLRADDDLLKKYGMVGCPAFVVIDRQGTVREIHIGYSPTFYSDMSDLVRQLLAQR